MTKSNLRHHSVHPLTTVKPNVAVNKKPEAYSPVETAALPAAPPAPLDTVNARLGRVKIDDEEPMECDEENPEDCEDDDQQDRRHPLQVS